MKKFYLLTKTLLVAALLMIGANAWAEVTPFSESYSSSSTTAGWSTSVSGRFTPAILNDDDNYYLSVVQDSRNNNGAVVTGNIISGKAEADDEFTVTFDMRLSSSSNQTNTEFDIYDASSNVIFSLKETGTWATTWKVNGTSTEVTLPNSNKAGGSNTIKDVTWCSYKITCSGGKTYLTITNKETSGVIFERTVISNSSSTGGLGNIRFVSSRYLANFAIDNIVVRKVQEGDVPTETYYTAKFTDNTTSTDVTLGTTIFTTDERTVTVANGMLEDGKTYYFTATQTAYQDYKGSFTVDGADPSVSFAMTAQPTYSYTVNAVDGSSNVLATLASGSSYNTAEVNYAYPQFILNGGVLYTKAATSMEFGTKFTLSSDKQVENVAYSTSSYENVVYYAEAESIEGMTADNTQQGNARCSNRYGAYTEEDVDFVTLPAGNYKIHAGFCGGEGTTFKINYGESTVWTAETNGSRSEADGNMFTADGTTPLTIVKAGKASVLLDNIIICEIPASVSATITSAGYATYCSSNALDFSNVEGLKAYIITGTESGSTLALSPVTSVPANTGVLLEGEVGTYIIPVVASSSTDVSTNKLVGVTKDTPIAAEAGYVLMDETAGVGFYKNNNGFKVGANTAYLPANFAGGAAREAYFFDGATGVEAVEAASEAVAKEGKFIVDGKLRIFSKGKMFNANGQLVK